MGEGFVKKTIEQKELPFQLTIVLHRHGEKASIAGDLSEFGKEQAAQYFQEAYKGVALDLDEGQGVDVESSPIGRTTQTALLSSENSGGKIRSFKFDERLSEGPVAHHLDLINSWGGTGGRWIGPWMALRERPHPDVKTGQEAVRGFLKWLLEKIEKRQKEGGTQEIDAFSHFPIMMAFLMKVEEITGQKLLSDGWQSVDNATQLVNFLESINVRVDSTNKNEVQMSYRGQLVRIPLKALEKAAE